VRNAPADPAVEALRVEVESSTPELAGPQFTVRNDGAFSAGGFVRDVGNTSACAAFIPATGPGTRFMWHPCRGSLRFGRVPVGQTSWDDAKTGDFSFAGGNQVEASGYGAFASGDQVNVSGTVGVGFGSAVTVSGTAGFSSGASNTCSGFACVALGYTLTASGQGSTALGYRNLATADYTTALGYRTNTNNQRGAFLIGASDGATTATNELIAQQQGELRVRAPGGIRLRTSNFANAAPGVSSNTGCDLAAGSGTWVCSSSRTLKSGFARVDGEAVLARLQGLELSTWRFKEDSTRARHLGPVAEDFYAAYGLGDGDKSIGVQDLAGVALVAAQALERRTAELDARTREVESLRAMVLSLEKRLGQLEHRARH
jgi:hypothetical protein